MRCPACNIILTRVEQDNVKLFTCGGCFGTSIAKPALMHLLHTDPRTGQDAPPDLRELAAIVAEADDKHQIRCNDCGHQMAKDRMHPLIPIVINICRPCSAYFLDVGKLPMLRWLYWELQHSQDEKVVSVRDKYGMAMLGVDRSRDAASALAGVSLYNAPLSFNYGLSDLLDWIL